MNSETISACRHIQVNSVIHSPELIFQVSSAVIPGAFKHKLYKRNRGLPSQVISRYNGIYIQKALVTITTYGKFIPGVIHAVLRPFVVVWYGLICLFTWGFIMTWQLFRSYHGQRSCIVMFVLVWYRSFRVTSRNTGASTSTKWPRKAWGVSPHPPHHRRHHHNQHQQTSTNTNQPTNQPSKQPTT